MSRYGGASSCAIFKSDHLIISPGIHIQYERWWLCGAHPQGAWLQGRLAEVLARAHAHLVSRCRTVWMGCTACAGTGHWHAVCQRSTDVDALCRQPKVDDATW